MSDCFTDSEQSLMNRWIGKGSKRYTLLYKATRDSCSSQKFHELCNNQGPTVSLLCNTRGCIFGGYNPVSWESVDKYTNHKKAFIFRLRHPDKLEPKKFPIREGTQYGMYNNSYYGPTFGSLDLCFFRDNISNKDGTFLGNGIANFDNCQYNMYGTKVVEVTANTMDIKEIEVYKVTNIPKRKQPEAETSTQSGASAAILSFIKASFGHSSEDVKKPGDGTSKQSSFRKDVFFQSPSKDLPQGGEPAAKIQKRKSEGTLSQRKMDLQNYRPPEKTNVEYLNILLVGEVGSGKTSFVRATDMIFSDVKTTSTTYTPTTEFRMHRFVSEKTKTNLKFRLCDTRGSLDIVDWVMIMDGHINDGFQFNPHISINPRNAGYNNNPTLADSMHCIVIVIERNTMFYTQINSYKKLWKLAKDRDIPVLILLPMVESLDGAKEHADKIAETMGISNDEIIPLVLFDTQKNLKIKSTVDCLKCLKKMMDFGNKYLMKRI